MNSRGNRASKKTVLIFLKKYSLKIRIAFEPLDMSIRFFEPANATLQRQYYIPPYTIAEILLISSLPPVLLEYLLSSARLLAYLISMETNGVQPAKGRW